MTVLGADFRVIAAKSSQYSKYLYCLMEATVSMNTEEAMNAAAESTAPLLFATLDVENPHKIVDYTITGTPLVL